jgi:hypothetical protein
MSDDDLFESADGSGRDLPHDQWGRYKLPHPVTGKVEARTRMTTFAKSVADTYALNQWMVRMAMKGLTLRPDLLAMVAATPDDNREKLNELAENAKDAAAARAAANLGTAMHAFAEHADRTGTMPPGMPPELTRILAARQRALADHRIVLAPNMIERTVYVPEYDLHGTFDRWGWVGADSIAERRPQLGEILDDKTGRDLTYGQGEISIQLAGYAHASHMLNRERFWALWDAATAGKGPSYTPKTLDPSCWEPMPPTRTDRAIVIHMPVKQAVDSPTELPQVTIFEVDIKAGWEAAQLCADVRTWRKNRKLFTVLSVTAPARTSPALAAARVELAEADRMTNLAFATNAPDEVIDEAIGAEQEALAKVEALETRPPTWEEKIRAASSRGDLSKIWREATAAGQWTAELEKLGREQLTKVEPSGI